MMDIYIYIIHTRTNQGVSWLDYPTLYLERYPLGVPSGPSVWPKRSSLVDLVSEALTGGPILIMRQKEMFTAIQPGPGVKESKHLISCLIGAPIHPRQYHVMGQKARLYCDM